MKFVRLNNGMQMPMLGLGTFLLTPDEAENSVIHALRNGYRLIDTANAYVNEKAVGRGIKKSGVPREDIFLETKLWPAFYEEEGAVDKTLERLDTDYIDLMILHQPAGNYLTGYKQLERGYKEGKLKAIGISNFNEAEILDILNHAEIKPSLIQVEAHPYYPQEKLNSFLKEYGIVLQSWYPLGGKGNQSLLNETLFIELGEKYHKTPAQIILRWHIEMGYIVIPGSRSKAHIKDNGNIFDFELSKEDMEAIAKLNQNHPIYIRTEEALKGYANWRPDVDGQK